jgi:hypothetical protein
MVAGLFFPLRPPHWANHAGAKLRDSGILLHLWIQREQESAPALNFLSSQAADIPTYSRA